MRLTPSVNEILAGFSGSMIALRTDPEAWYKLRSVAVNPLEDPHVTIIYMPDLEKEELPAVREAVRTVTEKWSPFIVQAKEIGTFPGAGHDGKIPHVVKLERQPLAKLHADLKKELQKIRPTLVDTKFKTYKPHTTLQWVPADTPIPELPEAVSWEAKEVKIYFQSLHREAFPFTGGSNAKTGTLYRVVGKLVLGGYVEEALSLLKVHCGK